MKKLFILALMASTVAFGALPDRPEDLAFPRTTAVTAKGTYTTTTNGQDFVLSGTISGNVTITASEVCRVTLDNVTLIGQLAITGDAILWAKGTSTLANSGKSVVAATGALMLGGDGTATLTGGGAKKAKAVIYSTDAITIAGGTWNVDMSLTTEAKGVGVAATKKLTMAAGSLNIVSECTDYKDTAFYSDKKDIVISGGLLRITQQGPKSVAINTDADDADVKLTGGAVILNLSGAGAKGIKAEGTFKMTDGILNATISGDPVYDAYEYGDGTNMTVSISSSTLVTSGTYLIEDVSAAAAVKCGTVNISGGTVRILANGIASRGIAADTTLELSGGVYDIQANGNASQPVIDLVYDGVYSQVEVDRKTAACIKQGDTNGVALITGGVYYLTATNYGGKCFSIDGALTVGTAGETTLPTDAIFAPDIQCTTYGQKLYVAAKKLSAYGTLGSAQPTTDTSSAIQLSSNSSRVTSGSGDSVDYTNPKCLKVETGITFESGRLRMFSKCDGGEGLESKANLTINGGIIEGTCYDDVIQATDTIMVNGGYIYAGSTGNDGIDANGSIVINGGVVMGFTTTTPEIGIDVDSPSQLKINGGIVLAVGSATQMQYGSSGTQKSYLATSASLSTYAGKYLKIANTSYYVMVPTNSSSGSCSIMCSAPGCTSSAPTATTTPAGLATGFHGVYTPAATTLAFGWGGPGGGGGWQLGGGNQPDQPGGGGGTTGSSFTYDTFLTDSTTSNGCISYGTLLTGYVAGQATLTAPATTTELVAGAFAGNTDVTTVDLSAATSLTSIPDSAFLGCTSLTTVILPSTVTTLEAGAFEGCTALTSLPSTVTNVGNYAIAYTGIGGSELATWIAANAAAKGLTLPSSYTPAALEAWLALPGNADLYTGTTLEVTGSTFAITLPDTSACPGVTATLQVRTSLDSDEWTSVNSSELTDGVYTPTGSAAFARVLYTVNW